MTAPQQPLEALLDIGDALDSAIEHTRLLELAALGLADQLGSEDRGALTAGAQRIEAQLMEIRQALARNREGDAREEAERAERELFGDA